MGSGRKVLVVGSGGREHALAERLSESSSVAEVLVTPGNAGIVPGSGRAIRSVPGDPLQIASAERVDLVVVGPEAPLCAGLVDQLTARGITAYGPSRAAAELEASKAFMKDFAVRHGIRTARHVTVHALSDLDRALAQFPVAPVVKADGLCAGKGVVVAADHDQARRAAAEMLSGDRFGAAGRVVVLEERISGREASVHAICDGERALILPAAQDHKRIGDGDTGPNTGGMGTYAPAPLITPELLAQIERDVVAKTLSGMAAEGRPFRGTLFAGIMVADDGTPMLLEFNVRFGDPETQVLMNVVAGDLADALDGAARGCLAPGSLQPNGQNAVCVVLASAGYPDTPRTGDVIDGLDEARAVEGVRVYHAGTRLEAGRVLTAGGRVLGVTGIGAAFEEARQRAYAAVDHIQFSGKQLRRDIGHQLTKP